MSKSDILTDWSEPADLNQREGERSDDRDRHQQRQRQRKPASTQRTKATKHRLEATRRAEDSTVTRGCGAAWRLSPRTQPTTSGDASRQLCVMKGSPRLNVRAQQAESPGKSSPRTDLLSRLASSVLGQGRSTGVPLPRLGISRRQPACTQTGVSNARETGAGCAVPRESGAKTSARALSTRDRNGSISSRQKACAP